MEISNRERVGRGLDLLAEGLQPFVERRLKEACGESWEERVRNQLRYGSNRADSGRINDPQVLLRAMWELWNAAFSDALTPFERNLVKELQGVRNRWAHNGSFDLGDTYRALDSMERLLGAIATPKAEELARHKSEVLKLLSKEEDREGEERRKAEEERRRCEEEERRKFEEERSRFELERRRFEEEKRRAEEGGRARREEEKPRKRTGPTDTIPSVEITEPSLLIRINRQYREGMSAAALYDSTRGVWKLGTRRNHARYAMSVYQGIVREVYTIERWLPAGTGPYETCDPKDMLVPGRWEFEGHVAPDEVRLKYLGESVAGYFKKGLRSPVVYVNCPAISPNSTDLGDEREAAESKEDALEDATPTRAVGELGQAVYAGPLTEKYSVRPRQTEEKRRRTHIALWDNLEEAGRVYELILTAGEVLRNTHLGGRLARPAQLALRLYEEGLVAQAEIGKSPMYNDEDDRLYSRLADPYTREEVEAYIRGMRKK
jgi:hypothetical protein